MEIESVNIEQKAAAPLRVECLKASGKNYYVLPHTKLKASLDINNKRFYCRYEWNSMKERIVREEEKKGKVKFAYLNLLRIACNDYVPHSNNTLNSTFSFLSYLFSCWLVCGALEKLVVLERPFTACQPLCQMLFKCEEFQITINYIYVTNF